MNKSCGHPGVTVLGVSVFNATFLLHSGSIPEQGVYE